MNVPPSPFQQMAQSPFIPLAKCFHEYLSGLQITSHAAAVNGGCFTGVTIYNMLGSTISPLGYIVTQHQEFKWDPLIIIVSPKIAICFVTGKYIVKYCEWGKGVALPWRSGEDQQRQMWRIKFEGSIILRGQFFNTSRETLQYSPPFDITVVWFLSPSTIAVSNDVKMNSKCDPLPIFTPTPSPLLSPYQTQHRNRNFHGNHLKREEGRGLPNGLATAY